MFLLPLNRCYISFTDVTFSFIDVTFSLIDVTFSFTDVTFSFTGVTFMFNSITFSFTSVTFMFNSITFTLTGVTFMFSNITFTLTDRCYIYWCYIWFNLFPWAGVTLRWHSRCIWSWVGHQLVRLELERRKLRRISVGHSASWSTSSTVPNRWTTRLVHPSAVSHNGPEKGRVVHWSLITDQRNDQPPDDQHNVTSNSCSSNMLWWCRWCFLVFSSS